MARPAKTGLDYFPLDVGFLRDKKVKLLRAEFGASSVLFVLYVFGKVYEGDGYFLQWDKDEALIAADELRESPTYISEVLQGCLSRSLFDERVFQVFGVLTSAGIQRRYLRSCEKRDDIEICSEYWLLDVNNKKDVPTGIRAKLAFFEVSGGKNPVNSPGNPVNSPENPQSKVKESKVKESKVDDIARGDPDVAVVFDAYFEKIGDRMTDRTRDELLAYIKAMGAECCVRAMDEAIEASAVNWRYVRGILSRKREQGVKCLADWDKLEGEHKRQKAGRGLPTKVSEEKPETARENLDHMRKMYEYMKRNADGGAQ